MSKRALLDAPMTGAIVLLSGGMDSAVSLFWAVRCYGREHVRTLAVDYGQRHRNELTRARRIAVEIAKVGHRETHLIIPWAPSTLTEGGALDPERVVIPGRNTILLTVAATEVVARGGHVVVIGCSGADAARFPDCRRRFLDAASEAISLGLGSTVEIHSPLVTRSKAETLELMRELGPDCERAVAISWSCYDPQDAGARGPVPCGKCLACTERSRGFAEAGLRDPGVP